MNVEHVVLPEPGRTLLMKTHAILAEQFPDAHGEPGFGGGGGTMLAARWKHRSSRDIDVRVSDKPGHQLLARMLEDPKLQTWMNWARVRADASVTIRDFGAPTVEAPDIESAAKIAIERGWEPSGHEQALIAQLKEVQAQAIARAAEQSLTQMG